MINICHQNILQIIKCKFTLELIFISNFIGHSEEVGIIFLATRKTFLKAKRKALNKNARTLTILFGFHLNVTSNCSVFVVLGYACAQQCIFEEGSTPNKYVQNKCNLVTMCVFVLLFCGVILTFLLRTSMNINDIKKGYIFTF